MADEPNKKPEPVDQPEADGTQTPPADRGAGERSSFLNQEEAKATGEHYTLSPEEKKARKRRSIAIALGVVAFVALVYLITMLRLAQNVGGPS